MEATTYSNRTNARRAGVAAGIPSEYVEITVHKNGGEVRFGWKVKADASAVQQPTKGVASTVGAPATETPPVRAPRALHYREDRNGVRRPRTGGLCAQVWDWLDAHPTATVKDAKGVAPDHGWNVNNVACEFYLWRKFNGVSGRQVKAT